MLVLGYLLPRPANSVLHQHYGHSVATQQHAEVCASDEYPDLRQG